MARSVVLVGGGRWGRVHAGVLRALLPEGARILWVSRHHHEALLRQPKDTDHRAIDTVVFAELEHALAQAPDAAIVVTAPRTHVAVARTMLERGIPTLVEKPLSLGEAEAVSLIELAAQRNVLLGIGLHLLGASYLRHFHSLWRGRCVAAARIAWFDPEVEIRYGVEKRPDISTPKVHDIYPHVWAIMRLLIPDQEPVVADARSGSCGEAGITCRTADATIDIAFGRRAPERRRRVEVGFSDGGTATLDFTCEPGCVTLDGAPAPSDPEWGRTPTPLATEISGFLAGVDGADTSGWPYRAAVVLNSVSGAVAAAARLQHAEATRVAGAIDRGDPADSPDVAALLLDNIAPELIDFEIPVRDPGVDRLIVAAAAAVLQRAAADANLCRPQVPPALFEAVRRSRFLRQVAAALPVDTNEVGR